MSPLARSLLALAAAALLRAACAAPHAHDIQDTRCTTVLHGSMVGRRVDETVVYIQQGVRSASIDIPNACGGYPPLGEQVTVCDDVAPDVSLPSLPQITPAVVNRRGNHNNQAAPVSVTLWCPY